MYIYLGFSNERERGLKHQQILRNAPLHRPIQHSPRFRERVASVWRRYSTKSGRYSQETFQQFHPGMEGTDGRIKKRGTFK